MLTRNITAPITRSIAHAINAIIQSSAVVIPDPTTVNFTSTQFSAGLSGSINTTKNASRIYGRASLTTWCGYITGTDASVIADSDYGAFQTLIQVSIDGSAFVNAPNSSTTYTLFSGLPHAKRFVELRIGSDFGDAAFFPASGNVLSVTGTPPSLSPINNWVDASTDSETGIFSAALLANASGYTPKLQAQKGIIYGSNVGSAKLKGSFTNLFVSVNGLRNIAVSKNGAAPTFYTADNENNNPSTIVIVPCDGSNSTYYVWDDGNFRSEGGHFAVGADAPLQNIGIRRRLDQFGDSITYGAGPGATSVNTETMRVAAAMGFVGSTYGVSGHVIAQCSALLDVVLPAKTVTSSDVAILAIGGNNLTDIDSTEQADYSACIDKLLAKGYGKILCRGILPIASSQSIINTGNAVLKSVMDAKANPKLVWIDTTTWTGYETLDNTHPTANGYVIIAGYALPAYVTALGL